MENITTVILHDRNDGFSTEVKILNRELPLVRKIVEDEKLNNELWNIDSIEERLTKELEYCQRKNIDGIKVIEL